jgi:uncharacterized membrane protein
MTYLTLKFLHILGACLFVGNNLVTPVWRALAERTRQPAVVAYSQRLITLTDIIFTGGGIALLLGAGHAMAAQQPALWQQRWFLWAYALFAVSGVVWLAVLLPIQVAQTRLARGFAGGGPIPERYWQLSVRWSVAGIIASLLPLGSLGLMIMKP